MGEFLTFSNEPVTPIGTAIIQWTTCRGSITDASKFNVAERLPVDIIFGAKLCKKWDIYKNKSVLPLITNQEKRKKKGPSAFFLWVTC